MPINTFTFSGHIGKDATTRSTQSGNTIVTFSLPCTSGYGDNKKTTWITCKMFGKFGEAMLPSLTKGNLAVVTGEFQLDEWDNDNGHQARAAMIVKDIQLGKQDKADPAGTMPAPSQQQAPDSFDDDQDIPF